MRKASRLTKTSNTTTTNCCKRRVSISARRQNLNLAWMPHGRSMPNGSSQPRESAIWSRPANSSPQKLTDYNACVGEGIILMDFYTPLFSKVVDSSLWDEPDFVVKVFLTMIAKKDRDQVVRGTAYNIARWSKKSEPEVLKALKILAEPDTKRLEPQPHEGRRIERAPGGWLILNGLFYQDLMGTINRRANKAKYERDRRLRIKIAGDTGAVSGRYLEAEGRFVEAHGAGDTAKADAIAAERLPAAPFSEIETVEQCIARTMNAGIPEEFIRYVHADWSSR